MSKVQLFVDGPSEDIAGQVTRNSASVGNGSHSITATATDSAGNSGTSARRLLHYEVAGQRQIREPIAMHVPISVRS